MRVGGGRCRHHRSPALFKRMRLPGCVQAIAAFNILLQVGAGSPLRHPSSASDSSVDARAFSEQSSARLRLLSSAARQVLQAPGVEEDPRFSHPLHKVASQLQQSATIMQNWGVEYQRNLDANDMAASMAEQGAAYEVADLKRQLRDTIEADQEAQLEQPKRLADLAKKVLSLRSKLNHLKAEEAEENPANQKTALLSGLWPRPPKGAKKADMGLLMHGTTMKVTKKEEEEEKEEHYAKLEARLDSLEKELQDARDFVAKSHAEAVEAHQEESTNQL